MNNRFLSGTSLSWYATAVVLNVLLTLGCSTVPPSLPHMSILLEKAGANRPPLGANLIIKGAGFTPGGQATVTISNTSPDGERQAQGVPVNSDGHFSTVFPFQCISFSKKYADFEMLAKARDHKTGRLTAASIKAEGFWDCPST